ncbi:MAG: AI-2E family transporter [Halioglobus sp.]|nr:AI-2E family transporter [Halioglobus sp.]|tara:strand:+ start:4644 stop:5723 length:1080 start_codon:yes stop_codon:yes gene_type:complete
MENEDPKASYDPLFVRNMIESFLRIGLLAILLFWSYDVIRPFMVPLAWGAIIAMAAFPLVKWLEPKLGGRRGLASTLVCTLFILVLVIPTWSITDALLGSLKDLTTELENGSLTVPPPNDKVRDWPLVGERVFTAWSSASSDLESFVNSNAESIREATRGVLKRVGSSLTGVLMFIVSIMIAGGFMSYAESCGQAANRFFVRVGGLRSGGEWAPMTVATVRGVLQGVVGIAVIQTTLIAIGMVVAGVPGTALWSAIVLVVAIAQLPPLIVMLPIIVWVFSTADTTTAIIFAVYQVVASSSDTFLKPLLLGRGLDIPMPVILIGAIGGMIASGVIGLFAGAVILSIWYKLFGAWLEQQAQ